MMKRAIVLAAGLACLAGAVQAEGLKSSMLPKARPGTVVPAAPTEPLVVASVSTTNAVVPLTRPRPRPAGLVTDAPAPEPAPEAPVVDEASVALVSAVTVPMTRPRPRPADLAIAPQEEAPKRKGWGIFKAAAVRTVPGKTAVLPKKGSVCGDPDIRGEEIAPITSRVRGCGIEDPVKVTAIAGVTFSQPATITCDTAIAAKKWIERGIQPAFDNAVVQLQIAGSYVCRPRNGVRGNKVSEHGRGRALDVSGFVLSNGKTLSVAQDYRKSKAMKAAHKAACGPYGTTLGPGSDGFHEDHIHVDIVSYRNGTYCR